MNSQFVISNPSMHAKTIEYLLRGRNPHPIISGPTTSRSLISNPVTVREPHQNKDMVRNPLPFIGWGFLATQSCTMAQVRKSWLEMMALYGFGELMQTPRISFPHKPKHVLNENMVREDTNLGSGAGSCSVARNDKIIIGQINSCSLRNDAISQT